MNSPQFSQDNAELVRLSSRIEQSEAAQAELGARLAQMEQGISGAEASLNRYRVELGRYEGMAAVNPSIEKETRLLRVGHMIEEREARIRELRAECDRLRADTVKRSESIAEQRGAVNALLAAINPPAPSI